MRKIEKIRIREGMSKTELAAELGANVDGVRAWMRAHDWTERERFVEIHRFGKLEIKTASLLR
jgi:uncharacterized protein YjcR